MNVNEFIGAWKYSHTIVTSPNGEQIKRAGSGLLQYSDNGFMSVAINYLENNRTQNNSIDYILFYAGKWQLKDDCIFHEILNCSHLAMINKTLIRKVQLNRNTLILTGEGDYGSADIHWERII